MTEGPSFDDAWRAGQSYETYMGNRSRWVAMKFTRWLEPPRDSDWIEVGCGTGALTGTVLHDCAPRSILAIDTSQELLAYARGVIPDARVRFEPADAMHLPAESGTLDVAASALVLNFLADRDAALIEMQRVLKPGGLVGFYVWDYPGGGMQVIDRFWKAAAELDEKARELDEARRFPFCTRDGIAALCADAGLVSTDVEAISIDMAFASFEEFWHPFTLGAGPAPGYCSSLDDDRRAALRASLARRLGHGPIFLTARAWAARGNKPWV